MNYEDILALVRAGYTKSEIDAMGDGAAETAPVQTEQPPAVPDQTKEAPAPAVPSPTPAAPAVTGTEALLQQLFGSVNMLTQAVQAQNRATITGNTQAQTAEEIARNATARMMGVNTEKE